MLLLTTLCQQCLYLASLQKSYLEYRGRIDLSQEVLLQAQRQVKENGFLYKSRVARDT